jgi:hypothetical protein
LTGSISAVAGARRWRGSSHEPVRPRCRRSGEALRRDALGVRTAADHRESRRRRVVYAPPRRNPGAGGRIGLRQIHRGGGC